jgi:hypothetical protein
MAYKFLVNLNKIIERRIVPLEAQNIYKWIKAKKL